MRCFSVSCNMPPSQISPHTVHIPCEASYVFGTGNEESLSPKSSIKRKHHAHCRSIATSSFHNRPITSIYICVARNAPGSPFRCGVLHIRLVPMSHHIPILSAFYQYSQNWEMALDNYQTSYVRYSNTPSYSLDRALQ